jgi:5'-methylthioadenosine phosphorylase
MVIKTLNKNTAIAQQALRSLIESLTPDRKCNCTRALADALITDPSAIPTATREKLQPIAGKYLKQSS